MNYQDILYEQYVQALARVTSQQQDRRAETRSQALAGPDSLNEQVDELNRLIKQKGEQA